MNETLMVTLAVATCFALLQVITLRAALAAGVKGARNWVAGAQSGQLRQLSWADARRELVAAVFEGTSVILFRRLGTMAPLLGVVLTVLAITQGVGRAAIVDAGEGTSTPALGGLISGEGVTALLAGVACGALLAIFNQLLSVVLHRGQRQSVVSAQGLTNRNMFRDTDDRLDTVVATIHESAVALKAGVLALQSATKQTELITTDFAAATERAAVLLRESAVSVRDALELPQRSLDESLSRLNRDLDRAGGDLVRITESLQLRSKTMSDTARDSSAQLQSTAAAFEASLAQLDAAASRLNETSSLLAASGVSSLPTEVRLTMNTLAVSADSLQRAASEATVSQERVSETVASVQANLTEFSRAVSRTTEIHQEASRAALALRTTLDDLNVAGRATLLGRSNPLTIADES